MGVRDSTDAGERWAPGALGGGRRNRKLHYLLVDEILEATVGLVLADWPSVDSDGRLRFAGRPRMLGAHRQVLEAFLARHRRPRALRDRPLRIGDVFAVEVKREALERFAPELEEQTRLYPFLDPETFLEPPVFDVTADARDEAKVAFYSAVTPPLEPHEAEALRAIDEDSHPRLPRVRDPRQWVADNARWLGATTLVLAGGVIGGIVLDRDGEPAAIPAAQVVRIESGPGITASSVARFTFSGASGYECRLDEQGDFGPCPPAYENLDERDHLLEVRAAGGEAVTRYPWSVVVPPEVEIGEAAPVTRPGAGVEFSFAPTSEGAETFQCRLDSELFRLCETPSSQRYPATRLGVGSHAFEVRSIQRGIPGRAAIHTWLVRAPDAPPDVVVRIESGPGITSETTARFEFSGAQEYECRLLPAEDDFAPCLPQYDDLSEDDYVLEVRATGSRTVVTYPFAVVIPPDVTIDQAPASSNGEAVTFVFSAPDNADSFECRLDGGAFEPCESPKTYEGGNVAQDGVHTFEVRAVERGVRGTTDVHAWNVNTVE